MKRILSLMIAATILMICTTPSFANECPIGNGLKKIAMSPMHVPNDVQEESKNAKFIPFGIVGGFLKGTAYMVKDIGEGTWSILTGPYFYAKKLCPMNK